MNMIKQSNQIKLMQKFTIIGVIQIQLWGILILKYFTRKNKEAHEDFDKAINLMSNNSKFYHSKGLAYQDAGEYDQAIK